VSELCHLAYGCAKQRALCGALEVRQITDRRDSAWLYPRLLDLASSLLSLCADESVDCHPDTRAAASELLLHLIRKCDAGSVPPAASPGTPAGPSLEQVTNALVKRLALELGHADAGVRDACKAGLRELARLAGKPVAALLAPLRETVLSPLLAGPLAPLPLPTQVATLEAVTFCIQEQSAAAGKPQRETPAEGKAEAAGVAAGAPAGDGAAPEPAAVAAPLTVSTSAALPSSATLPADCLIPLGKPLLALLQGALSAAQADETPREPPPAATPAAAPGTVGPALSEPGAGVRILGRHVRGTPMGVRLRVVAIELLCATLSYDALKAPPHVELRNQMIGCFFKSLTVRSEAVVAVARDALASVIAQSKLQKELLQSSLRPILLNLADYRKLSVPLLQGLSRLLSLLSNFFNLTLGEKLLEHLRRWNDPEFIAKAKTFKPGDEVKIPCAILSLFHLLPPAPDKFLVDLISVTMTLEAQLPGSTSLGRQWSPHREVRAQRTPFTLST